MSRRNPYALDPNLMQGFSNLTRALIGSASDDAALARAKASEATARYRDSQTAGQNQDNEMAASLYAAGNALATDPAFQSQIAQALGLDTLASGFMGPPAPGQMRLGTDNATNMARTALGKYGNADQMTSAFNNVGQGADNSLARSMILEGTPSEARRGFQMLGNTPGKYFDEGFAGLELSTNDATNRRDDDLDYNLGVYKVDTESSDTQRGQDITSADNRYATDAAETTKRRSDDLQYGEGGQGDRNNTARDAWERYKADRDYDAKVYDTDTDDTFARWKHDNRDIEIAVEPGKQIVVNPEAGKKLGIQPDASGLYVLDGGPKPGAIIVKVGKEDVYLTEADAKALGIKKNDAGQYVIPGKPELAPKGSGGSGSSGGANVKGAGNTLDMTRYQEQFKKDVTAYINMEETPLPGHAIGAMNTISEQMIRADLADNEDLDVNAAYSQNVIPMLSAGAYTITEGRNFNVPNYFVQYFARMPQDRFAAAVAPGQNGGPSQFADLWTGKMKYSDDELQRIYNEVLKLRAN